MVLTIPKLMQEYRQESVNEHEGEIRAALAVLKVTVRRLALCQGSAPSFWFPPDSLRLPCRLKLVK